MAVEGAILAIGKDCVAKICALAYPYLCLVAQISLLGLPKMSRKSDMS